MHSGSLVSGLNINQSFKLLMLISKCHLNVNVDSKNEKPLSRHSGMLLSRNPVSFVCLKSLDPSQKHAGMTCLCFVGSLIIFDGFIF